MDSIHYVVQLQSLVSLPSIFSSLSKYR